MTGISRTYDQFRLKSERTESLAFEAFAAEPGLEWEWEGVSRGEATEGGTVRLTVRADSLRLGTTMTVRIEAAEGAGEVRLSHQTLELTVSAPERVVEVGVLEDGQAEGRERVLLRLIGEAGSERLEQEAGFAVARHGYELRRFVASDVLLGQGTELRAELNGPAASTVLLRARMRPVRFRFRESGVREARWAIGPGQSSASVSSMVPDRAEEFAVELLEAEFAGRGAGRDQRQVPGVGTETRLWSWRREDVLSLSLDKRYLAEGDTATLTVRTASLLGEEELRVSLEALGETDLIPVRKGVELSAEEAVFRAGRLSAEVEVEVLSDGGPEPRQLVRLRGGVRAAGEELREETYFVVPRRGYTAVLRVHPEEVNPRGEVTVELELNAEAPASVRTFLELEFPGRDPSQPILSIARGERVGVHRFRVGASGEYRVRLSRVRFGSRGGNPAGPEAGLDQSYVETVPMSATVRVRAPADEDPEQPGGPVDPGDIVGSSGEGDMSPPGDDGDGDDGPGDSRLGVPGDDIGPGVGPGPGDDGNGSTVGDDKGGGDDPDQGSLSEGLEWKAQPEMAVLREGEEFVLQLRALRPLEEGESIALSVEVPEAHRQDLELRGSAMLELSAGGGGSSSVRVIAVRDGEAEPLERVRLLLRGQTNYPPAVSLSPEVTTEEVVVVIPRNEYALSTMTVQASSDKPADEFVVGVELNAPAPTGEGASTVQMTVRAFAGQTDELRGELRLQLAPGELTGSGRMILRSVGVYMLSAASASFTVPSEWGGQEELDFLDVQDAQRSVHFLLDYESAPRGWTPSLDYGTVMFNHFYTDMTLSTDAGFGLCTEEARTALTLEGRMPCLDVSGDGVTDLTDAFLVWNYMLMYRGLLRGEVQAVLVFSFTDLDGVGTEEDAERVIRRVQGLFPRTPRICREFGLACD